MSQFDNVSVVKTANVYFDGKCVSHTVILADGTRKSVGVIFTLNPDIQYRRTGNYGIIARALPCTFSRTRAMAGLRRR